MNKQCLQTAEDHCPSADSVKAHGRAVCMSMLVCATLENWGEPQHDVKEVRKVF